MKESSRTQFVGSSPLITIRTALSAIVLFGLIAYSNAIGHPFVHDDVVFIVQNPSIGRWDNIADAFIRPSMPESFAGLVTPYYRPILEVYYRLGYALFGLNPSGFHALNVFVHIANAMLLFVILRRILRPSWAFWIAVIFVVHPVQTEAVACISGISNLLCGLFILGALFFYIKSATVERRAIGWLAIALLLLTAALLTKEQAVFAFLLMAGYEWFWSRRPLGLLAYYRLAVVGLLTAGYLFVRQILFGSLTASLLENPVEFKLRLLGIPRMIETFLGSLFVPAGLHYYRSVDILAPKGGAWAVALILIVTIVLIVRRLTPERRKMAVFGLWWFAALILPVLNFLPLVNEYSFVAASEHGLYLPMVGILIFLAAVCSQISSAAGRGVLQVGRALLVLLVGILCIATIRQNAVWRGEIPLFERALAFEPQLGRVHVLLAKVYLFHGRPQEAWEEFAKAETIISVYERKAGSLKARRFYQGLLKGIYSDSAQCALALGHTAAAMDRYNRALAIDRADDQLYAARALLFLQTGQIEEGIGDLETARRINPGNIEAANNLGIAYIQAGDIRRAREILEGLVRQAPWFAPAQNNLERLNRSSAGR